jgi:excinuclease ABC subunit A
VGAPKVGEITGLPPAVSLQQRRSTPTSRSSVGTVTNLSNSLRMLFSRAGDYPPGAEHLDSDAFSPNTAAGACPECHGLGRVHRTTEESLVPDPSLSIREGAIAAWPGAWQGKNLRDILDTLGYDVDVPWRELPAEEREWILFTDEQPVVTVHPVRDADRIQRPYQGTYMSAHRYVMKTFSDTKSQTLRAKAERFLTSTPCPVCGGSRLRAESLAVTFAGRTIADLAALPLAELAGTLWTARRRRPASSPRTCSRIAPILELGLGYLSLDRATPTLSAGELQRLRLATQLRSGLFGVVYVLDEPSAGLHPADTKALLTVLDRLKAAGNSVFVVEHHLDVMRGADWLVDVGPKAGEHGGRVLHSGPVAELAAVTESATARFLFDDSPAPAREVRSPRGELKVGPVTRHNLRDVTAEFPLGVFTAVTGVSGSGKSTLIGEITEELPGVGRLVSVDQKPIGRTPARTWRRTPASSTSCARSSRPRTRHANGVTAWAGSPSTWRAGRCETCQGEGFVSVELLFLPSTYAPCPDCGGARYNPETLQVTYRGRNIAQVLDLTVESAAEFFADTPAVARSLPHSWTSASATCGWASPPPSCPAARPNASSWPASCSAPAAVTPSTSSTNRRPASTRPTSRSSCANSTAWSTPATPSWWSSTTWRWWRARTG